jgi:hypothetical protein
MYEIVINCCFTYAIIWGHKTLDYVLIPDRKSGIINRTVGNEDALIGILVVLCK